MGPQRHQIAIRADAGEQRGAGHVMRCMTMATAALERGHGVELFSVGLADGLRARAAAVGIGVCDLDPEASPEDVATWMNDRADLLVIDGYHLGELAVAAFAVPSPVMLIDDNGELPATGADLILNQNLQADEAMYVGRSSARLLLGTSFAMIRPDVLAVDRARVTAHDILVAIGGTDPLGLTLPLTSALLIDGGARVWLGRGAIDTGPAALAELAGTSRVQIDPGDLTMGFAAAAVAVIGGGSMMWEVAHLGIPAVVLVVADNQQAAAALAAEKGFVTVHDARDGFDPVHVAEAVQELITDHRLRDTMSRRGQALIDGGGAHRVVTAIEELVSDGTR